MRALPRSARHFEAVASNTDPTGHNPRYGRPEPENPWRRKNVRQLVIVPVIGNKAPVGLLLLGSSRQPAVDSGRIGVPAGLRQATRRRGRKFPPARTSAALAAAVDQYLRFHSRHHSGARCRLPHHQGQSGFAWSNSARPPRTSSAAPATRLCLTRLASGPVAPTARWVEMKNSPKAPTPASAASRWFRPLPTPNKAARKKARSTSSGTLPIVVPRKRNIACSSSRSRKAFTLPIHRGPACRL